MGKADLTGMVMSDGRIDLSSEFHRRSQDLKRNLKEFFIYLLDTIQGGMI